MKIRLFLDQAIDIGQHMGLDKKQSHYLRNVLRAKDGDVIFLFNNQDGEFETIAKLNGKNISLVVMRKTHDYYEAPNICLAFAPVKNVKTEYIVTKATELGVREIRPVMTERTIIKKVNLERLKANIIEAAEQCERTDLAEVKDIVSLKSFLKELGNENLILADESGDGKPPALLFKDLDKAKKSVILIGPEGGFSTAERELIKSYSNTHSLILGPRILRADTAIISSLMLMQNYLGDIEHKPSLV